MAVNYNYDGPPSLELYQDFIRTTTEAGLDQNVVVVAQHYDVVKADSIDAKDLREYSCTSKSDISWDSLGTSDAKVDKTSVNVVFKDAALVHTELSGKLGAANGNLIVLDSASGIHDDSVQEDITTGDVVLVTAGDSTTLAEIVSVKSGTAKADLKAVPVPGFANSGKGLFNITGEYVGSDKLYYIEVMDATKATDSNTVILNITTSDGTDAGKVEIVNDAVVPMANSGLYLSVNTFGFVKGEYYQVAVSSKGVLNKVYLNTIITGDIDLPVTVKFGKSRSFTLDKSQYITDENGISMSGIEAKASFGDDSKIAYYEVLSGKFCVEYRAISSKFDGVLGYITSDNVADIGYTGIENPLGALVSVALRGGRGVYCTSVKSDTVAEYRKAFVLLSKSSNAYAIVLGSLRPDVIIECDTLVTAQAAPDVVNYKIMYYGLDDSSDVTVLEHVMDRKGVTDEKTLATISNGKVVLTNGNDYTGFCTSDIKSGDILRTNYSVDSFGNTVYEEYIVDYVYDDNTLYLTNTSISSPLPKVVSIYRELEGQALVDELKSRVYTKNHRSYCVFGDGISIDGSTKAPAWLLAALPAGMRAGEFSQRPISNLTYTGVSAVNKLRFNSAELKSLASAGVWILANSADGTSVYNYHQLSTDMSDKKLQEQSYTTNFDSISASARGLLSPYYGNSNISEEFLQQLYADLAALLGSKTANAPNTEVGPQLVRFENLSLTQDPVNTDHVYMEVDYYMPAPFNHVTLRQRLM